MLLFLVILTLGIVTQAQYSSIDYDDDVPEKPNCHSMTIQKACPNMNVTFWLYNSNVNDYQLNEFKLTTITQAPFNDSPFKIILHGYAGNKNNHPNIELRPVYLRESFRYNVISIDYSSVVHEDCLGKSVHNAPTVSKCFAEFVHLLLTVRIEKRSNQRITIDDIHVIGHSLGAQIAGNAGRLLRKNYDLTLPRLTALDAAIMGYYLELRSVSRKSAKFVDILHTSAGFHGKLFPVGHVDFYINYIPFQQGCNTSDRNCRHSRAPAYFAETVVAADPIFCGRKTPWDTMGGVVMGEYVKDSARGLYFVKTNEQSPFAKDPENTC